MKHSIFDVQECLHELKHYLPSQAPLKDFIHHNTLHAFEDFKFHEALHQAAKIFGYQTYLSMDEYSHAYETGKINDQSLEHAWQNSPYKHAFPSIEKVLDINPFQENKSRIGQLRSLWKEIYFINLDKQTHPTLFRLLNNYLDQGISLHHFPVSGKGFIESIRQLDRNSYIPIFKSDRVRLLFEKSNLDIEYLLSLIVGEPQLYTTYLFDQQFAHPGWSGLVSVLENNPNTLYDKRTISLSELIKLELLLELDALDTKFGTSWKPLAQHISDYPKDLFALTEPDRNFMAKSILQDALEWTYYYQALGGIRNNLERQKEVAGAPSFKALFCIDDRECSLRRHIETLDPHAETFGTPGFFHVEFHFQPQDGKFYSKVCPAPITPRHLIIESSERTGQNMEVHMSKHTHSLLIGMVISQTLGFWSALKLFFNIFKPGISPASSHSFRHMDKRGKLSIELDPKHPMKDGLQVGFTVSEMADRVEGLLKSIGLTQIENTLVYAVGHGASSVNNTHYAGYDCGACSGRPGSVNARVISFMGNHPEVRKILASRGVHISDDVRFVGALHDTTRDEIEFYDLEQLNESQRRQHEKYAEVFAKALDMNAKERSRRFILTKTDLPESKVHERVKLRSVSLFEPRPELNHATNALCIVGRRHLSRQLFLDRRAFLNSYDYRLDEDGQYLSGILSAVAPVCGGINLEYYFSRTDNQKLGAGSKLPHNVMGLVGVANGTDGDLRTGLPWQMVEVHDPIRLLCVVEQFPDRLLSILRKNPNTENWFKNEWIHLVAIDPETNEFHLYHDDSFIPLEVSELTPVLADLMKIVETHSENLPVSLLE